MQIHIDFPFFLTCLVLITGLISILDLLFLSAKRKGKAMPWYVDNSRAFFPVLLIVLILRSFIVQPYRVPTGSLEPTILPGDFIVVNQFAYGLRLPVINTKIYAVGEPKIGDIALFRWPKDTSLIFVKRVIGTPGDHIVYKDKHLEINGKPANQKFLGLDLEFGSEIALPVKRSLESLPSGISHEIFVKDDTNLAEHIDIVVPPNNYFMMGDNRDDSEDSRVWGLVPEENLIGKVFGIWMSWDSHNYNVRWNRIGKAVH